MTVTTMDETPTILVFGGYTEPWLDSIDSLHEQAGSCEWLRRFLSDVASVVRAETRCMHPKIRNSLGPSGVFTSVQEIADLYRDDDDGVGFVQCIMSYIVRAAILLRWVHESPDVLKTKPRPEGLGISGGLINAAVLAISNDFDSLYQASVVTAGLVCRLCEVAGTVSRAVQEDVSDGSRSSWGCAVMGSSPDELDRTLHQIQESKSIPILKRARVGIRGDSWGTVVGPPSVLDMCLEHIDMSHVAKQRLPIYSMQHNYNLSQSHREHIAGDSPLHVRSIHPGFRIWGVQEIGAGGTDIASDAPVSWGRLLLSVADFAFSKPVDLVDMVKRLNARLGSDQQVKLRIIGPTWFAGSLASKLKAPGRRVLVVQHTVEGSEAVSDQPAATWSGATTYKGRIAVVGMAGRAPECDDLEQYWQLIEAGRDVAREIPPGRFDADSLFQAASARQQQQQPEQKANTNSPPKCTSTCKLGCFLSNPGHYDARFFRVSPREALLMDPGSRLFQMVAHEALESCGYSCGTTRALDPSRIGVLFGQSNVDGYETAHHEKGCDPYTLQTLARPFPPARVAYHYGWEGPTYSIDQACSTSLSLIHLACGGLNANDYDMVVAGAANVLASPHGWCLLSKAGVLSDTGNCKTFRDDAQGYCRGEFVGVVVLKRLEDAVAHNDNILAVIPGSARNQAGNSAFLTASDAGAEERVLRQALRQARLNSRDIAYAEMHGTATPVGDPCEMTAVAKVLGRSAKTRTDKDGAENEEEPLTVGSVKANIGHSEASSGIASMIKSILMFQKNILPPQAGMPHALNKQFPPLDEKKIRILSSATPFTSTKEKPRRVLINNFDAAGGNTALILEDFRRHKDEQNHRPADPRSAHVVVLSAHTAASHHANKTRLSKWLRANPGIRLEDVAYTTTARRVHQPSFRFACHTSSITELIHLLESDIGSDLNVSQPISSKSPVVFVFSGQGSHYAGMGAELYRSSSLFRDTVDLCTQICDGFGFPPFLDIITGTVIGTDTKNTPNPTSNSKWNTSQTQLALVTLEISLATFWRRLGIEPALVMGHSLGEYVALYVAGVLSLTDTLYLVGSRAALAMEKCRSGSCAMLAVSAPVADLRDLINVLGFSEDCGQQSCSIACTNSPTATVLSGTVFAMARVQAELKKRSIRTKMLTLPFGFHSSQVDAIPDDFKAIASGLGITYSPPRVPVVSTMLGSIIDAGAPSGESFGPEYLTKQLRNPVDFVGALHAVQAWAAQSKINSDPKGSPVWLEIGPGEVCASFVQETLSPPAGHVVSSLSAASSKSAWATISECLASLYTHGCDPDWMLLHAPFQHNLRLITLPSYAWDVRDFWIQYREKKHLESEAITGGVDMTPTQPISTCAQYVVDKAIKDGKVCVTIGASLSHSALLELIEGHRMQGVGLCPGSVFSEAAFVAAKCALEHGGRKSLRVDQLSLHRAHLQRPLTASLVGTEGEMHTTAFLQSENLVLISFKALSQPGSSACSFDLGNCSVVVKNAVAANLEVNCGLESSDSFYIRARMREVTRTCSSRLPASIFYALFSRAVQYGSDDYRCLHKAFVSDDFSEAVAEVVLAADPPGLRSVASSPYWGEALGHLAGFLVNCHPGRFSGAAQAATSFIMDSLERFEQAAGSFEPGRTYFTYARVLEKKVDTAVCEVVVFDDKDRLVMRTWRMRFHEIPNTVLQGLRPNPMQNNSDAILQQASDPSVSLVQRTPGLGQLGMTNDTASGVALSKKDTGAQHLIFGEDGIGHQDPKPGSLDVPSGLLPVILESIAEETGLSDTSELTNDASLTDLGVDSIMAVEICAHIKAKSGHQLSPSFILEHPTIGHLSRMFGEGVTMHQEAGKQVHKEYQGEMRDSGCRKEDVAATNCHETEVVGKTTSTSSTSPALTPTETPPPESQPPEPVETNEPPPKARIMLLQQGRPRPGAPANKARLYFVCDGTGSISNYIHLLKHQFPLAVYGIDSPFLRCPSRFKPEVGIPGAARYMVEALVKLQPNAGLTESILIGGFSGGALFGYEMCRQLTDQGRRVDGIVILDMRCPLSPPSNPALPPPSDEPVWEILFATAQDSMAGQIHGSNRNTNTTKHLRAMFRCVLGYHPPRREVAGPVFNIPAVVIWCAKGMLSLLERRPALVAKLVELGYPVESYRGYMEDARLGAMAWSIPHKRTKSDLGPGGWEHFLGGGEFGESLLCLAVDADHHSVLHPMTAPRTSELIDQGVTFLLGRSAPKD